jgi:hypothetical protein
MPKFYFGTIPDIKLENPTKRVPILTNILPKSNTTRAIGLPGRQSPQAQWENTKQ